MVTVTEVLDIVRPLSVLEFHRLIEAGIFEPEERVELIDGVLIAMAAMDPPHASLVSRIGWALSGLQVRRAALVREEKALVLGERDELYPDVCLVRFRDDDYATAHPSVAEAFLVVEVANTSLRTDRRVKLPRYAQAQVPEVWIANIPDRQLEVHRDPAEGQYRAVQTLAASAGGMVAPAAFSDFELDVAELFRFV